MKCFLILESGKVFEGRSVGGTNTVVGELIFNTSMCGYLQAVSDPASYGKIIIMTYPLIGAAGYIPSACESGKAHANGIIMCECSEVQSNYLSEGTFSSYLKRENVSAIEGIDTRMLTKSVRNKHQKCMLTTDENYNLAACLKIIKEYTPKKPVITPRSVKSKGGSKRIAVLDLGVRNSLLTALEHKDCKVSIFSSQMTADEIIGSNPDRIIISGGAGNPEDFKSETKTIKSLVASGIPLLAFDLGHLVLAQSFGMKPVKLKQGLNGTSVPAKCTETGRIYMTAQNTVYSISAASVDPAVASVTYTDVFGETVMGLKYKGINVTGYAFHINAGPYETLFLLDEFLGGF